MGSGNRTIAHLQFERLEAGPERTDFFSFEDGTWTPTSNRQVLDAAEEIAAGLWSLGVRRGDRVAVMAETRPEWSLVDTAALDLGATVVSVYPSSTAAAAGYILTHSGSKILIVEDSALTTRLRLALEQTPELEHVVVIDPAGLEPGSWTSLEEVRNAGRMALEDDPDLITRAREAVQPSDLASLMYTSGTTGDPKGVPLTHDMLFTVVETLAGILDLRPGDAGVAYLPMSHILQRVNNYLSRHVGMVGYYAPAITELVATCKAANPRTVSGVPRVYEKIHAAIMAGVAAAPPGRQKLFERAVSAGGRMAQHRQAGRRPSISLALAHRLFDGLVLRKLRAGIFGENIESLYSGAAPISPEIVEFFYAIGLPIYDGYGLTETSSPITLNRPGKNRVGTVGTALPGSEVRIADDGEILLRGPSVFEGYFRNPGATAAAFTEDGWFKSGDIGVLDEDGYLKITDRKKAVIITAGGKNIAPAPIESRLVQHPLVGQVVVHGDRRRFLTALFTLDPDGLAAWSARRGRELAMAAAANDPEVLSELETFVESVNADLASFETIKRFKVLPVEFSVENELLTPSLKIKRNLVEQRFAAELDGLYEEAR